MVVPRNLKKKGEGKWKRTCDIRFELYYEDMTKLKIKIRRIGKPTEEEEDFLSQRSCGQTIQEHYQQNNFRAHWGSQRLKLQSRSLHWSVLGFLQISYECLDWVFTWNS